MSVTVSALKAFNKQMYRLLLYCLIHMAKMKLNCVKRKGILYMKKVCIIGHFGFGKKLLNGQTIKTKTITNELVKRLGNNQVMKIDTHGGIKAIVKLPFQVLYALINCRNIIILPANNGLRIITPLLYFCNSLFRRRLHYIVIGGWLQDFIANKKMLKKQLQHFDYIYVETSNMKKKLDKMDFSNILIMPNCKALHILKESELLLNYSEPYKICTFSRVMKEKGIEEAIYAVESINQKLGRVAFELDIYGQVDSTQVEWFEKLRLNFPNFIQYKGCIPYDESTEVLKKYYLLLFPTFYDGEGFAGTIIDAFAAGLPVIASDWKYNAELVSIKKTGLICKIHDVLDIVDKITWAVENKNAWYNMKMNCIRKAHNYQPSKVINLLLDNIL